MRTNSYQVRTPMIRPILNVRSAAQVPAARLLRLRREQSRYIHQGRSPESTATQRSIILIDTSTASLQGVIGYGTGISVGVPNRSDLIATLPVQDQMYQ